METAGEKAKWHEKYIDYQHFLY